MDIAREKAGIIKPGAIGVVRSQDTEVALTLARRADDVGATLLHEGSDWEIIDPLLAVGGQAYSVRTPHATYEDLYLPVFGTYAAANAAAGIAAVEALVGHALDDAAVREGLAAVHTPGRLERVAAGADVATVLVDAAHNPDGAHALAAALTTEFRFTRLIAVVAAMRDKDVRGILAELEPVVAEIVVTANSSSRTMDPDELGRARGVGVRLRAGERRAGARAGDRAGPGVGRGGGHLRGRGRRHRLGGHGGGGATAVRSGAVVSELASSPATQQRALTSAPSVSEVAS